MPTPSFNLDKLKELARDRIGLAIIVLSSITLLSLFGMSIALIVQGEQKPSEQNPILVNTEPEKLLPGKIGNKIWIDSDRDGIQGQTETGSQNHTVYLIDSQKKSIITSIQVNEEGEYIFENIMPGIYEIQITIPDNLISSAFQAGENRETDNDFTIEDQSSYGIGRVMKSNTINLQSGEEQFSIDAGVHSYEEIKGIVWQDMNSNNNYDESDKGIQGIIVSLLDGDNNVIDSRVTQVDGIYKFNSFKPGKYAIKFESNQNYSIKNPTEGTNTLEQLTTSPFYTDLIEVKAEQKLTGINQMFYELTPEIRSALQVPVPSPTAAPSIEVNDISTIAPTESDPTITPVQTTAPTPIQTTTPEATIETMDEGTGTGSEIGGSITPTRSSTGGNLVTTGIPIFVLTILGGINLLMLNFTKSDRNEYRLRKRRLQNHTYA